MSRYAGEHLPESDGQKPWDVTSQSSTHRKALLLEFAPQLQSVPATFLPSPSQIGIVNVYLTGRTHMSASLSPAPLFVPMIARPA